MSEEPSQVEPGIHPKLTNPLSEETRKERLYLLAMSAIGITIVFTGLIPTKIKTLGITFIEADQTSLLLIFALVVAYFLAAFVSYALSDYLGWVSARNDLTKDRMLGDVKAERARIEQELADLEERRRAFEVHEVDESEMVRNQRQKLASLKRQERMITQFSNAPAGFGARIVDLRFVFEFLLPPIVGAFAIVALFIKAFI